VELTTEVELAMEWGGWKDRVAVRGYCLAAYSPEARACGRGNVD